MKKVYYQPILRIHHVITENAVAQMVVNSQEHEDQWAKERDDFDYESEVSESKYGNLW